MCLGYKGTVIKDYFRNFLWHTNDVTLRLGQRPQITYHDPRDDEDWTVTLLDTGEKTQTGGRLQRALAHVKDDRFLFTYGDGLTDADINGAVDFHEREVGMVTLTAVKTGGRFGELSMDGSTITAFREKPQRADGYINGGFMAMNRSIGDYLTGDDCSLEQAPLVRLATEGKLKAFPHEGFWQCMDTYREQQQLEELWNEGTAPWAIWS